ncbi:hypothetical protein LJB77_01980 [Ruminococcaceae bacterium OttesenSCG-928-N02]|nr:hypothetical protein [Ruminococcaceae bacterium OttesenSCG-928-N02]
MKKVFSPARLALALSFVLVLGLFTACGGNGGTPQSSSEIVSSGSSNTQAGGGEYAPGVTTDNHYESEFLNLQFDAPGNHMMISGDLIEQLMQTSMEYASRTGAVDGSELEYALGVMSYEMLSTDITTGTEAAFVVTQHIETTGNIEDIPAELIAQSVQAGITSAGVEGVLVGEVGTASIAGAQYAKIGMSMHVQGLDVSQTYYLRVVDDYLVYIVTMAVGTEGDAQILNCFSALK